MEEQNNQMTIKEILKQDIDILNKINIPINMIESIGFPIKQVCVNLEACVKAFDEAEKKLLDDIADEVEKNVGATDDTVSE